MSHHTYFRLFFTLILSVFRFWSKATSYTFSLFVSNVRGKYNQGVFAWILYSRSRLLPEWKQGVKPYPQPLYGLPLFNLASHTSKNLFYVTETPTWVFLSTNWKLITVHGLFIFLLQYVLFTSYCILHKILSWPCK